MIKEAIELILSRERAAMSIQQAPNGEHFIVLPTGTIHSLAPMMPPARVRANVALIDVGSFCDYVNRFKNQDTLIFAAVTEAGAKLTAIIDYHGAPPRSNLEGKVEDFGVARPDYCNHRATLELIQTDDWKAWVESNGPDNAMTQEEFAVWLEEHSYLFNGVKDGSLKGADLLEMVCSLQAKSNVRYNRSIRLQDGRNSLDYEEDVSVTGNLATGSIVFPQFVNAQIQPFEGGPKYYVDARLKTHIGGRQLSIWYETVQLNNFIRAAVLDTVKAVSEKTGLIPFIGTAQ